MHHILVDFENVRPKSFSSAANYPIKFYLFMGANQNKVGSETNKSMALLGKNAQCIKYDKTGKNALDFYITFFLGTLLHQYPNDTFHIISRDTGFDSLTTHLREASKEIYRHSDFNDEVIHNIIKKTSSQSGIEKNKDSQTNAVQGKLIQKNRLIQNMAIVELANKFITTQPQSRALTFKGLKNQIYNLSGHKASESDTKRVISILTHEGHVIVKGKKIIYPYENLSI